METTPARLGFQRSKLPAGISRFSMNRMPLGAKRGGIAAKWQAEEVAAQDFENGRQGGISLLFGPRRDRVGLEFPALAIKRDGA